MGKTKAQILDEKETEVRISEMPDRLLIDKINCLQQLIFNGVLPKESVKGFSPSDFQEVESAFDEIYMGIIKEKVIELVKQL